MRLAAGMSTWLGVGNGAASARQAAARSVRNSVADRRRIGFGRIVMALRHGGTKAIMQAGRKTSQVGGFRKRTVRHIYDRSNLENAFVWSVAAGLSESLTVLNKFGPSGHGEAQVQYLDGDFRVISPGTYVRCAITDVRIPLDELKYWSVDLQEAYSVPTAVLQRHFPGALKTRS